VNSRSGSAPVVYLIDAHYQIFRAYHSLPDLRTPDGRPVGAVRGYAQVLLKFLRDYRPTHLAAAFDFAMTSFRNDIYPDYKAGRTEAPQDLEPQFAICEAVTRALGIPVYQREGFEADDILATLVRRLRGEGADAVIVTRDKDLGALVDGSVRLLDLKDGSFSGPPEIRARLGVEPHQVTDYLTLVGDAVDGIPGVRGIGAKTGALLLEHFGRLEAIPHDADALKRVGVRAAARVAESLRHGAEQIELSRKLVQMCDDLPLEGSLETLAYTGARRSALESVFGDIGAQRLLERVPSWQS